MIIKDEPLKFEMYSDAEIIEFTHMNNSDAWQGLLTKEEYTEREKILGTSEIAQKNTSLEAKKQFPNGYEWLGLKYFVLKDTRLPNTGKLSQIVSSCETLNRLGYCTSPNSNGKIEFCLNVCIGGVFTEKKFRGKSYARAMIEGLNEFYENIRDQPDASPMIKNLVIILYSEVGNYYSKMGYHSFHVPLHNIKKIDELFEQYCGGESQSKGKLLKFDDYEHLINLQDEQFKKDLLKSQEANKDSFIFMIKPDLDIFKWFQYRDIYIQEKTNNGTERPFGFELEDKNHIIWHHNWNDNYLVITKIFINADAKDKESILKKLLGKAIIEAKKTGFTKVQFWDFEIPLTEFPELERILKKVCDDSDLYAPNGSISAVRPPPGFNKDSIIWEKNAKYCWF